MVFQTVFHTEFHGTLGDILDRPANCKMKEYTKIRIFETGAILGFYEFRKERL